MNYERFRKSQGKGVGNSKKVVASYSYPDEDGKTLYEILRYDNGGFEARRWSEEERKYIYKKVFVGIRKVLYRLTKQDKR